MFGKLKDKLKKSLSIFSKKTEEEAEEIPKEKQEEVIEKEVVKEEKAIEEKKQESVVEKKKEVVEEKQEEPVKKAPEVKKEAKPIEVQKPEEEEEKLLEQKPEPVTEPPREENKEEEAQEKKSLLSKLKQKLTTKTITAEKFESLFWDIEVALLENNVSVLVIEKIKENLQRELVDKPLPRDVLGKINEVLEATLREVLSIAPIDIIKEIKSKQEKPFVITFFGINGSGKTTSIAKLAHYLKGQGFSVVLAACDTFRAAAIDQLQEHATKLGVKMIKHEYGSDAAAVAFDAVKYAQKNKIDVVLVDTAGRLHSNTNLMAELQKLLRVNKPDLKVFVGESITGNDCCEQAEKFNEALGVDGMILTKADVDEMGGAPLSIAYILKKPILFLGMGQTYDDFEVFTAEKILERLGF